jgi:hypothetical protein
MGLDSQWKLYLQQEYSDCWSNSIPSYVRIDVIISDYTEKNWSFVAGKQSYESIKQKSIDYMINMCSCNDDLEKFIILFDDKAPPNKEIEQISREKGKKIKPLTEDQIREYSIAVPYGNFPQWEPYLLIVTRPLRRQLSRFLADSVFSVKKKMIFNKNNDKDKNKEPIIYENKNLTIIIDSVYNNQNQTEIVYMNQFPPDENDNYRINNVQYVSHINSNRNNNNNNTDELKPQEKLIGESDLKIPYYISQNLGKVIYIDSTDSDLYCILLLNMRDWIDPITGQFKVQIYVYTSRKGDSCVKSVHKKYNMDNDDDNNNKDDSNNEEIEETYEDNAGYSKSIEDELDELDLEPGNEKETLVFDQKGRRMKTNTKKNNYNNKPKTSSKNKKEDEEKSPILDVNKLYVSILKKFKMDYNIDNGVIIFTILAMFAGTDYVDRQSGIGKGTIWNAFCNGGYKLLSNNAILSRPNGFDVIRGKSNTNKNNQIYPSFDLYRFDIHSLGEPHQKHFFNFDEFKIAYFFRYIYQYFMTRRDVTDQICTSHDRLQAQVIQYNIDKKEEKKKNEEKKFQRERKKAIKNGTFTTDEELINIINSKKKKINNDGEAKELILPSEVSMMSTIKRILWNIRYWVNGSKLIQNNFPDPFEINPKNNLPKWGWEQCKKRKACVLADVTNNAEIALYHDKVKKINNGLLKPEEAILLE